MKMKLFKSMKLNWWQMGLFKVSVFSLGIIFGVYFTAVFSPYIPLLWVLTVVPGLYIAYVWLK